MKARQYQKTAVMAAMDTIIGQVILPTGTGKSFIQSLIIDYRIGEDPSFGIYAILTPRILLTNQLMASAVEHLRGIELLAHTIHSGKSAKLKEADDTDEDTAYIDQLKNDVSTGYEDAVAKIEKAYRENRPVLFCSTYDSCGVLATAVDRVTQRLGVNIRIKQVLCDEAHYILETDFHANVARLKAQADHIHFFTATQKIVGNTTGNGMDNESFYGPVIARHSPHEMITAGYMVKPRIHYERATAKAGWDKMVMDAFEKHCRLIAPNPTAKLLVCCDGSKTIAEITNKEFRAWAMSESIKIFDISCAFGPRIDGASVERNDFLDALRKHTGKAIILHISILTEGIDVPDMSGVMLIRNMGVARLLQSIGRATRPHTDDLGTDGEPLHKDVTKLIKPDAWVIITERNGETDTSSNLENIIKQMRLAGFLAEETVIVAVDRGTDDEVAFDPSKDKKTKMGTTFDKFFEIFHEIEKNEQLALLADMTDDELFNSMPV